MSEKSFVSRKRILKGNVALRRLDSKNAVALLCEVEIS